MPAPIELFYWPTPNGKKITIALHEMGELLSHAFVQSAGSGGGAGVNFGADKVVSR